MVNNMSGTSNWRNFENWEITGLKTSRLLMTLLSKTVIPRVSTGVPNSHRSFELCQWFEHKPQLVFTRLKSLIAELLIYFSCLLCRVHFFWTRLKLWLLSFVFYLELFPTASFIGFRWILLSVFFVTTEYLVLYRNENVKSTALNTFLSQWISSYGSFFPLLFLWFEAPVSMVCNLLWFFRPLSFLGII